MRMKMGSGGGGGEGEKPKIVEKADEMGEGVQCIDHPYRNHPGGICAFCLQDKLGKLVSTSKSISFFPVPAPSSNASSPARSDCLAAHATAVVAPSAPNARNTHLPARPHIHFFTHNKKIISSDAGAPSFKRSRSVAISRRLCSVDSPRVRRDFWSFLHLSRRRMVKESQQQPQASPGCPWEGVGESPGVRNESPSSGCPASSSLGRRVSRSRSVGCGSRSFSGDFLERISMGLGDCALRRVESQREADSEIVLPNAASADGRTERVKCGGIFGIMSGSSSSSWMADDFNGRILQKAGEASTPHGRRSWGWAFASPMRAFRPSSTKSISITAAASDCSSASKHDTGACDERSTADSRVALASEIKAFTNQLHPSKIESSPSLLTVSI